MRVAGADRNAMSAPVIVMGVAGSGKTSLGQAVAAKIGWPMVEGDDFHPESNRRKMGSGEALTDEDRAEWLDALVAELSRHTGGVLVTCSALKRSYRDRLRAAAPGLRFIFLDLDPELARRRVMARQGHVFPVALVGSQFNALEVPDNEGDVLRLDASEALCHLSERAAHWVLSD
jgi:gluconokinase